MKKIVVIGSSNTDMIVKVARIPVPGETILGGNFIQAAGGKGANQAVAAARCGGQVSFIANTGNDNLGKEAKQNLLKNGIDISHVFTDETQPSGVALIFVAEDGENSIAVAPGANATLKPDHILQSSDFIVQHELMLVQLETPMDTIRQAVDIARKNNVLIILNPAPAQVLPEDLLAQVDILIPNESETELITGIKIVDRQSMDHAAKKLRETGVKTVIITLGSKGVFVLNDQINDLIPAYRVNAADTTAAGDTFCGALAAGISQGKSLPDAIKMATAAAALSTTKLGAQPSIPDASTIEDFMDGNPSPGFLQN